MSSYPPLQITPTQLLHTVNDLKIDSASGPSGWTNYIVKMLFGNRHDPIQADGLPAPGPLVDASTAFANTILAGDVTSTGRELLVAGRLTMIGKRSGNGFSPICMDCCAYRAVGATSVVAARARLPSMQPLQFGGDICCDDRGITLTARASPEVE